MTSPQAIHNFTPSDSIGNMTSPHPTHDVTSTDVIGIMTSPQPISNVTPSDTIGNMTSPEPIYNITSSDVIGNVTSPEPIYDVTTKEPYSCDLVQNLHSFFGGILIILLNAAAVIDIRMNRAMRGWSKVLLVNLLTSDALTGVFSLVYWFSPCLKWAGVCDMFLSVANVHVQVLCVSVIYITVSRLLLLLKGPSFRRVANAGRALAVVILSWVVAVTTSALWVMLGSGSNLMGCIAMVSNNITPHVIVVPLTFIVVCPMYVSIIHLVRKQLRQVHQPHPAVQNLPPVPRSDNETKVTVVAILIISCFCVCYLPGLYVLWGVYLGNGVVESAAVEVSLVMMIVHPIVNPLLYGWRLAPSCLHMTSTRFSVPRVRG